VPPRTEPRHVEWEHVFLELRFGEHYRCLRASGLDEQRIRFYRLALHLSLIAGPLRLLDGDYPDHEPMLEIVEANIARALALLQKKSLVPPRGARDLIMPNSCPLLLA
jgi:hypothetical protein